MFISLWPVLLSKHIVDQQKSLSIFIEYPSSDAMLH